MVRSSRNGGSWPSSTRSVGASSVPATRAVVRQSAGDRPQQGRLAGAVLPDQADPPPRLGDQVDAGQGGAVTERDGEVAEDDGLEPRDDRHAAVLTEKRDSPGVSRGRESGQALIHMMHPAYVELRLVIH